jgi:hypothetical protein
VIPLFRQFPDESCECGQSACRSPGAHELLHIRWATDDAETVRAWWEEWPEAPIGVALQIRLTRRLVNFVWPKTQPRATLKVQAPTFPERFVVRLGCHGDQLIGGHTLKLRELANEELRRRAGRDALIGTCLRVTHADVPSVRRPVLASAVSSDANALFPSREPVTVGFGTGDVP